MDGSLATSALDVDRRFGAVPTALIEACGLPEVGSRLEDLSVRTDLELSAPFRVEGTTIAIRPDVAASLASVATALREAIELTAIAWHRDLTGGSGEGAASGWVERILGHAMALTYAETVLRQRVDAGETIIDGLLVPEVDREMILDDPQRAAQAIAAFVATRDRLPKPQEGEVEAAARALALSCPTEVLLCSEGDDRQDIDWRTGRNSYGIEARPVPWTASFASCTASSPTFRAFDAARAFRLRLIAAGVEDRLSESVAAEVTEIRATILASLGVAANTGVEVVLTPSGTDAELVALAVSLAAGEPVRSIMIGPAEVGSGSTPAAGGRHFSTLLPSGEIADPDSPLRGLPTDLVEVTGVSVRDEDGALVACPEIEERIEALARTAPDRILLHVVEGSKTGVRAPRADFVAACQARLGERIDVVVDAAQMRIDQPTVKAHLDRGRMIVITGSKFFGGPPFSGAVLIPAALAERLGDENDGEVAQGLADYLTKTDVPDSLSALRAVARPGQNLGLLTRWVAALAEMRSFHNASPEIRDEVLRRLAAGARSILEEAPGVRIVESPFTAIPDDDDRGLDDLPTIFTFEVIGPDGQPLTYEAARLAQRLVARDLTGRLRDDDVDALPHQVAARSFHLGQPVRLYRRGDGWIAGLRIAVGAPTVSQIVFDHTRGATWTDRIEVVLSDMRDSLEKLALVVARFGPAEEPSR